MRQHFRRNSGDKNSRQDLYSSTKTTKVMEIFFSAAQQSLNGMLIKLAREKLLRMKLLVSCLLFVVLQSNASGFAQVSINEKNAPLQKVLRQIAKQAGYDVLYNVGSLENAGKVTLDLRNVSLNEAMEKLLASKPLSFSVIDRTIVIKPLADTKPKDEVQLVSNKELSQGIKVSGLVLNENKEPVVGASVLIKGTTKGVATNQNGVFELTDVDPEAILVISAVNIETTEFKINSKSLIQQITVKSRFSPLDEVQLIAYGQTTKRFKTGAVTSVKAEVIEKQPVYNPIQALQGRVAGVAITQTSGALGSNIEMQIRGVNTIQSGNQPLFILDGAILPAANRSGSGGYMPWGASTLNAINPADIESIEILKDADATSIYGSRGANGVVIITSKKAKLGASKVTVDVSTGINQVINLPKRMGLPAYLKLRNDAFNLGNYNPTTGVAINPITPTASSAPDLVTWDQNNATQDWAVYEFGNRAPVLNVQTNFSGGNKKLNFYASAGYLKQNDITRGNPYQERISGSLNIAHVSVNDRLRINFNTNYVLDKLYPSRGAIQVLGGLTQSLPPNMPLRNPDGTPWFPSSSISQNGLLLNPDAPENATQSSITKSYVNNLDLNYRIYKGLTFKTQIGFNYQVNTRESGVPSTALNPINPGVLIPNASFVDAFFQSLNIEPQLNYTSKLFSGKLDVLMGATSFSRSSETYQINFDGFTSDLLLRSWSASTNVSSRSSVFNEYKFSSLYGRVNYQLNDKYLLNLTFRRDGSSRFGPNKQWGDFGAFGLGWIFSSEQWAKQLFPFVSFGKLRMSYGKSGNDNIPDFRWTNLFTASNIWYNGGSGLASTYLSDPSIGWESSYKTDAALELGILKDRILFNINWYRTKSTDLLADYPVPSTTGFNSFLSNIPAVVENKGWEFELTTNNTRPNATLQWRTNFNITLLKNKLLEFPDLDKSAFANRLRIGLPVNSPRYPLAAEWTQKYEGVDPATGLPVFKDFNKDGIINATDIDFVGSAIPRTFGGLGNTISYKGFDLDIFFQFSQQFTSNWLYGSTYPGQLSNPVAEWEGNYWRQPGDITKYPRPFSGTVGTLTNLMSSVFPTSSVALTDLMYIRLKNLSITYNLPTAFLSRAKLSRAALYLRGQNLLTWTSTRIDKDPELVQLRGGMMMRSWSAGIQVSF